MKPFETQTQSDAVDKLKSRLFIAMCGSGASPISVQDETHQQLLDKSIILHRRSWFPEDTS